MEFRVLAATGILGSGFPEDSIRRAMEWDPHVIGCDAGSTDPGPYLLGSNKLFFPHAAYARDLRLILRAAAGRRIPVLIGSAGGAGTDRQLEVLRDILTEAARQEGLHFRLALIRAEQDKQRLHSRLRQGRIRPLDGAVPLTPDFLDETDRVVAMMGAEPFQRAIEMGAEVVLAGRSSDTAIYAALPLAAGQLPGPVWHAAKVLECGAAAVEQRLAPDCMFAVIRPDGFSVTPPNPRLRCTPVSVAAHSLYENPSPYHFTEPSGTVDTTACRYEPESDRGVRVTGTQFHPADRYTVKLEGASLAGYQALTIAGIRDPFILQGLEKFLAEIRDRVAERARDTLGASPDGGGYDLLFRVYGHDGTMGPLETVRDARPHEVGLVIQVTAHTQERANTVLAAARHIALHHPVPRWSGLTSNLAFPYAPADIERGPTYRFTLNHVLEPDDPFEPFPIELIEV
jgi:hypothetical protein